MPPPTIQEQITALDKRMKAMESLAALPTHYHNGFDSNQVSWIDVYQKKIYVSHTIVGTAAATAANYGVFFIVPVACLITKIQEVHQTVGSDGGAVTLTIEKLTGTQALDAGASTLASTIDLKGTINTVVTPTLSATSTSRTLAAGDRLAMDDAGTLTAVANVTILIELQY